MHFSNDLGPPFFKPTKNQQAICSHKRKIKIRTRETNDFSLCAPEKTIIAMGQKLDCTKILLAHLVPHSPHLLLSRKVHHSPLPVCQNPSSTNHQNHFHFYTQTQIFPLFLHINWIFSLCTFTNHQMSTYHRV